MITALYDDLQNLRSSTEILEALDWDEEKFSSFITELELMLISSPPNIEKALFWMKNTPWDTFNKKTIPERIYVLLEKNMRMWERRMKNKTEMTRKTNRPPDRPGGRRSSWNLDHDEWN